MGTFKRLSARPKDLLRNYTHIESRMCAFRYRTTLTAINAQNIVEAIVRKIELFRYEQPNKRARTAGKNSAH